VLKQLLTVLLVLVVLLMTMGVYAATVTYTVNYAKNSKYKVISLKNATLQIKLHMNGTPKSFLTKQTNEKQTFTLINKYGNRLVVEVISIKGEPKNISCHGTVRRGKTEILIDCHSRYSKKHFY